MTASIQAAKRTTPEQLSTLPVTNEATIDEEFLDANRHMNVSWYLHLFNQATGGMYSWMGIDWPHFKANGSSSFILEGHIRYLNEVLIGQHVTLRTRFVDRTPKRLQFLHFMFNDDNRTIAATYEVVLAHIDMASRRMAPFPPAMAAKLDVVVAQHQALDWEPPVCGVMHA